MPIDDNEKSWNQTIIANFRENAGKVTIPPFVGANLLLLTTTGATSGKERTAPLGYTRDGERYVVVGSNSGAPAHSAWLSNVKTTPIVSVEIGLETFRAQATVTTGEERRRLWQQHIAEIPVVVLERLPAN